jgi:hypothetical protein
VNRCIYSVVRQILVFGRDSEHKFIFPRTR